MQYENNNFSLAASRRMVLYSDHDIIRVAEGEPQRILPSHASLHARLDEIAVCQECL
jgi:hypothetical protein